MDCTYKEETRLGKEINNISKKVSKLNWELFMIRKQMYDIEDLSQVKTISDSYYKVNQNIFNLESEKKSKIDEIQHIKSRREFIEENRRKPPKRGCRKPLGIYREISDESFDRLLDVENDY